MTFWHFGMNFGKIQANLLSIS